MREGKPSNPLKEGPASHIGNADLRYWQRVNQGVERADQLLQQAARLEQQAQQLRGEAQQLIGAFNSHLGYLAESYKFNPEQDLVERDGSIKRGALTQQSQTTPA